jgi:serine protease Do
MTKKRFSLSISRVHIILTAAAILFSTSAGFVGGWLGARSFQHQSTQEGRISEGKDIVLSENEVISKIAREVGESVVSIRVLRQSSRPDFFGFERSVEQESAGTGFILSDNGIVLTNRHVVPLGTESVRVTLSDGTELSDVRVIGRTGSSDPLDVAFLKIDDSKGKDLKPVELGNSAETVVGSRVIAIGNALGQFQNTVTAGIISGYGRSVEAYDEFGTDTLQNLFQTDAAINEGNSGGPLVDINGKVIGINTAIAGGGAENIGFAIPIDDIRGLISGVLETGELKRPYLGVRYVQLTDDYASEFNLSVKRGAYVVPSHDGSESILPDSPAEKAGLQEGDVITRIDDVVIDDQNLASLIGRYKVGATITLTIVRENSERQIKVTLEAAPTD